MIANLNRATWIAMLASLLAACNGEGGGARDSGDQLLSREELLKPETCNECHPKHYREWSASMHAYASTDPVFIAMNKRGQREAKLGEFCVNCHAPMAVREGATKDGLNLDEVPDHLQGVTCYFCHNAVGSDGDHNNMIRLANDQTMRGSLDKPKNPKVHRTEYSAFHDRRRPESSQMCGGCHDIITPDHATTGDVHLERTFAEYKASAFSRPGDAFLSCQSCHMLGSDGVAAVGVGAGRREVHEHLWAAVDVPLTPFPHRDALRAAVEECELPQVVDYAELIGGVTPARYDIQLETGAGHSFPSGSAHDRRVWLELVGYDADGKVIYENGKIADDEIEVQPEGRPGPEDKPLWTFHDRIYGPDPDGDGEKVPEEVHMFWDAAKSEQRPTGYESSAMPAAGLNVSIGGHTASSSFSIPSPSADGPATPPSKLEVRLRVRPIGLEVLQDLVDSKDLDPAILDEMPTFTAYSARFDWLSDNPSDVEKTETLIPDCDRYKCLLDPQSSACDE